MLIVHSKYSLRYGIIAPEKIIDWAIESGYNAIALADINTTSAVLSSLEYAKTRSFHVVVGIDVRTKLHQHYVLLAMNNRGFHELNEFLSYHLATEQAFPKQAPYFANCYTIYPVENTPSQLRQNERIGVHYNDLKNIQLIRRLHAQKERLVALTPMTFMHKRDFNAHRLLRAIDENCLLSQLKKEQQATEEQRFLTKEELLLRFNDVKFIISQTEELLSRCKVDFQFGEAAENQNLNTYTGSKEEDKKKLKSLCYEGISYRYQVASPQIEERIAKELEVIEKKGYLAYFLVTWDIIHFAKSQGFFHVGRGSGANSIVAYLLGITDVDPLELDLFFERFINLYRKNPPDFDIDFSWKDRDEVIHYIFKRFKNVALLCTYNTFQFRATVRELGKVFGLPKNEIDLLVAGKKLPNSLDDIGKLILKYSSYIEGLPSHLSIHAGGIIISEKPISWFTATFIPPKGFPTTQFSMLEAEDVGLYKYDVLSQRGLSKIHDAVQVITENRNSPPEHSIHHIAHFKRDKKIQKLLQNGDAMGCFYVESPAMRMLMKKLNVTTYLDLVAASSIIRPGVSSSGMMKEYILRHKNPEKRKEAHPVLLKIMPETYGVMVYQEDVIKVAHLFAGLSLDEADVLRRGMSGKYRSKQEFQLIKQRFFTNCLSKGYSKELTQMVWRQIESFAGYAFAKGHSASFAVESFQSLYLKAYYPLEYMVATINNGGGYYRREIYIQEAKRQGAKIELPEINESKWLTTIKGKVIYLGFHLIQGIEQRWMKELIKARGEAAFTDMKNFFSRVSLPFEQLELLIKIGAFRRLNPLKKALLWDLHFRMKKNQLLNSGIASLFLPEHKSFKLPSLESNKLEQAFDELELLGFSLTSPFLLLQSRELKPHILSRQLPSFLNKTVRCYGYLISLKRTTTKNGQKMYFGHFYDTDWELLDTVHFPLSIAKFPFRGMGVYELIGVVTEEFGYYTLTVSQMEKLPYMADLRYEPDGENLSIT